MNTHPEAPAAPPLKGRHRRPGKAGSALALVPILVSLLSAGCAEPDRSRNLADSRVHGAVLAQQVCANCHGPGGNSVSPNFPALAGQSRAYLATQLRAFRDKSRHDPQAVAYMFGLARSLTDTQIDELADYYSAQSARPQSAAVSTQSTIAAGQAIYLRGTGNNAPACVACHGDRAQGTAAAPRLAGQHAAYIERQLRIYQTSNDRPDGGVMKLACSGMTAEDMRAVAAFVQSLAAAPPG
ncbi:MAG TPA: c-type cytochrome [Ramlibacter sp.]|nr:c-type cytochrome [Ramlibacter sp.]